MRTVLLVLAWSFVALGAKPTFEVASVKPSADSDVRVFGPRPGGRLVAQKLTLKTLVFLAYSVREERFSGGPGWIDKDEWNIEAKADSAAALKWPDFWPDPAISDDPVRQMLTSLLEERFHLRVRREMKEAPVYELLAAKNGSRLRTASSRDADGEGLPHGAMRFNPRGGFLVAHGVPVARLALALSDADVLGRPVIDKTGLDSAYDFRLEWAPGPEAGPAPPNVPTLTPEAAASRASIFSALQEQLGLRVESTKGPVASVIIEHVEKPAAN